MKRLRTLCCGLFLAGSALAADAPQANAAAGESISVPALKEGRLEGTTWTHEGETMTLGWNGEVTDTAYDPPQGKWQHLGSQSMGPDFRVTFGSVSIGYKVMIDRVVRLFELQRRPALAGQNKPSIWTLARADDRDSIPAPPPRVTTGATKSPVESATAGTAPLEMKAGQIEGTTWEHGGEQMKFMTGGDVVDAAYGTVQGHWRAGLGLVNPEFLVSFGPLRTQYTLMKEPSRLLGAKPHLITERGGPSVLWTLIKVEEPSTARQFAPAPGGAAASQPAFHTNGFAGTSWTRAGETITFDVSGAFTSSRSPGVRGTWRHAGTGQANGGIRDGMTLFAMNEDGTVLVETAARVGARRIPHDPTPWVLQSTVPGAQLESREPKMIGLQAFAMPAGEAERMINAGADAQRARETEKAAQSAATREARRQRKADEGPGGLARLVAEWDRSGWPAVQQNPVAAPGESQAQAARLRYRELGRDGMALANALGLVQSAESFETLRSGQEQAKQMPEPPHPPSDQSLVWEEVGSVSERDGTRKVDLRLWFADIATLEGAARHLFDVTSTELKGWEISGQRPVFGRWWIHCASPQKETVDVMSYMNDRMPDRPPFVLHVMLSAPVAAH